MTTHPAARRAIAFLELPSTRAVLLILGYLLAAVGVAIAAISFADGIARDGGLAYDFNSYYLAGQRYLAGQPLYTPVEINDPGAYRYLPTFAALMAPLTIVPELALTWIYRVACLVCLRYLVGSWRAVGWSLLFPPVLIELWSLNVTLPLAAGARWALTNRDGAAMAPAQAVLKYSSVLLLPYLWLTRPGFRPGLLAGSAMAILTIGFHMLVDPSAWRAFGESLLQQAGSTNDAPYIGDQLLFFVPSTVGDFALRLTIASILTFIAIWKRWDWLVFTAVVLAVPTLWLSRLAPLVAVPRLLLDRRGDQRGTSDITAEPCRT